MRLFERIQRGQVSFCGDEATRFISLYISATTHRGTTSFEALRESFHAPADGVLLVSPLLLKRIIRAHRSLTDLTFRIPRATEYLIGTAELLDVIGQLDPNLEQEWTQKIKASYSVLLAEPSPEEAANYAIEHFGLKYWALMAHALTHRRCLELVEQGTLNEAMLKRAISRIGVVEFEEIRDVLATDHRLFDPKDNLEVLLEFVAYWVQVTHFTPELTRQFFPAIKDAAQMDALLTELGVDQRAVLEASEQPHTPTVPELLRRKARKQSESQHPLEIHQFAFHSRKIMRDLDEALPELGDTGESDRRAAKLRPLVTALINQFIDQDRIVRGLTFADLEREVLWGGHDCTVEEMLMLDRVLTGHLERLYRRASPAALGYYVAEGEAGLQRLREDTARREVCARTVAQFETHAAGRLELPAPGLIRLQCHEALRGLRMMLYGWVCLLLEWFHPRSMIALKLRNRRLLTGMKGRLLEARFFGGKGNAVARLLALRSLLSKLERAGRDHPTPAFEEARQRWRERVDAEIAELADDFCSHHPLPEQQRQTIHEMVAYLVERAEAKQRGRERRLLFDLRTSYEKMEQQYRTADFAGWVGSLFRRPLVQALPFQPRLAALKYLRKVAGRIRELKVKKSDQDRYVAPIEALLQTHADALRAELEPIIAGAFEEVGMRPADARERVSLRKLKREIDDQILATGRFQFSYLRDVISRNDLRMPDLDLPGLVRDPLLRLDRVFKDKLLGVYGRGTIYLQWLQRASALLFGTLPGRLLTLFCLLPAAGSYIILEGLDHTLVALVKAIVETRFHFTTGPTLIGMALVLLAAINFGRARAWLRSGFRGLGWLISRAFRAVMRTLTNRWVAILHSWLLAPLMLGGLFASLAMLTIQEVDRAYTADPNVTLFLLSDDAVPTGIALLVTGYALAALLLHSYPGRALRDWFNHLVADTAVRMKKTIWGGLFGAVMQGFSTMMHTLEHFQYTVENRLRSNVDEGRLAFAGKALLGVLWFWVSYMVTIYVVLLIEPQINPIKHFPVVTVSHKVMLPMLPQLTLQMKAMTPAFVPSWISYPLIGLTIFLLPGLCGFMVWELKENWKLYRANRSEWVTPVLVGSHGETLPRLLRRGFHSGTIPKLLGKMRSAGLAAHDTGDWSKVNRFRHKLHHVEETVEMFAERELIQRMLCSERFSARLTRIHCGHILTATNKIEIPIRFTDAEQNEFELTILFEDVFSWIIGSVAFDQAGYDAFWPEPEDRLALDVFLAVFFKKAGIELVREQLEETLLSRLGERPDDGSKLAYGTTDAEVVLTVFDEQANRVHGQISFSLTQDPVLPRVETGNGALAGADARELPREQLVFGARQLGWPEVTAALEAYEAGHPVPGRFVNIARVRQQQFEGIC